MTTSANTKEWWQELDDTWKKLLCIHLEFQKKGIDYAFLTKKQYWCNASLIYESEFGQAFKMPENPDIENIQKIEFLWIGDNKLTHLNPLKYLSNLKIVDCVGGKIESLEPLKHLRDLEILSCQSNQITSLEPLKRLTKLQILHCQSNQIKSLAPLDRLTHLKSLNCNCNKIETLTGLEKLFSLEELKFQFNKVSSLFPIKNLRNLKKLDYRDNKINYEGEKYFQMLHPTCEIVYDTR